KPPLSEKVTASGPVLSERLFPRSSAPASSQPVPESGFALQPAPQANAGTCPAGAGNQDRSVAQPTLLLAEILSTNTVLEFSPRFPTSSAGWAPRVSSQQQRGARTARFGNLGSRVKDGMRSRSVLFT
uniref:Uncharacterized protein n=1 Tax=Anser brachyrhynchus TaxID=132585 RepID=A0A8B9BL84_9AVES